MENSIKAESASLSSVRLRDIHLWVRRSIIHVPQERFTYVNNPKCACSTIKSSIWRVIDERQGQSTYKDQPHDRLRAPFPKPQDIHGFAESVRNSYAFSVVRNPYARLLSAYLDKVMRAKRDQAVWKNLCQLMGFERGAYPDFPDFVKCMVTLNPFEMDPHFAPQHINLMSNLFTLNDIGYVEVPESVNTISEKLGVQLQDHAPHVTNAAEKVLQYFDDELIELTSKYYDRDFSFFGYDMDMANQAPTSKLALPHVPRVVIEALISASKDPKAASPEGNRAEQAVGERWKLSKARLKTRLDV